MMSSIQFSSENLVNKTHRDQAAINQLHNDTFAGTFASLKTQFLAGSSSFSRRLIKETNYSSTRPSFKKTNENLVLSKQSSSWRTLVRMIRSLLGTSIQLSSENLLNKLHWDQTTKSISQRYIFRYIYHIRRLINLLMIFIQPKFHVLPSKYVV